jgi:PAS domain S-box-containing protein
VHWKFAFGLASDDLFFVTTKYSGPSIHGVRFESEVTTFPNENDFLKVLIAADLPEEKAMSLALAVLVSVAKPMIPPKWVDVDLTPEEMEKLCLPTRGLKGGKSASVAEIEAKDYETLLGFMPQVYELLMHAPSPMAMVMGPEHRFVLLNKKFTELTGAKSASEILGKTMLELAPKLKAQPFVEILDRVYETGERYAGREIRSNSYIEAAGGYLDTTYQPIANDSGEVVGILIQSSDMTERQLERSLEENREQLLYRQWAELDAIYRNAPIGLILIDAKDLRVQRLNERQAALMGGIASEFLGKRILDLVPNVAELPALFERVITGQPVENHILEGELITSPGVHRYWLVNYAPTYSGDGKVEAIVCASLEISSQTKADIEMRSMRNSYSNN